MNPLDWDLIDGPAPALFAVAGGIALLWLAAGRRRFLVRAVLPALAIGAVGGSAVWFVTEKVLNSWGAPQPAWFYLLGGLGIAGVVLAVAKVRASPRWW